MGSRQARLVVLVAIIAVWLAVITVWTIAVRP